MLLRWTLFGCFRTQCDSRLNFFQNKIRKKDDFFSRSTFESFNLLAFQMAFETDESQVHSKNKKPHEETEHFENDNRSELEGVSDSGEGEDAMGNECVNAERPESQFIMEACQV